MARNHLVSLVEQLEQQGKLVRISEYVNPELEITEVTDRVCKSANQVKALLFENSGTSFPVLTNLFASEEILSLSLGIDSPEGVSHRVSQLLAMAGGMQKGLRAQLGMLPQLTRISRWFPKRVAGKGACQEVVQMEPDLAQIPILKCWPHDGGRFITLPLVHTRSPLTGARNVGMYRMQVMGPNQTGMHWHRHKTGASHYREYKEKGELMPVAVAIGGDPVYSYCATAPLPENIDEYLLAGFLRKERVKMVKCITNNLEVPSDVDFVIEGYVDPSEELVWEGPFGDHTGFYSLADWYPKFHVTCITHRKEAIYPATIVGVPPMEDAHIANLTQKIFLAPIQFAMAPELVDLHLPSEGVAHNLVIASINKTYPGQAYKVGCALWGAGQMMFNKVLVVVDGPVDVRNPWEVAGALAAHFNPATDFFIGKGPLDVLDHPSDRFAFGGKMIMDATKKLPEEATTKAQFEVPIGNLKSVESSVHGLHSFNYSLLERGIPVAIIGIDKSHGVRPPSVAAELLAQMDANVLSVLVMVDREVAVHDFSLVAWFALGNIDVLRDCFVGEYNGGQSACLVIDGTRKCYQSDQFSRPWPNVVVSQVQTIGRIDSKWEQLNLGAFIPSPSLQMLPLVEGDGAIVSIKS